MLVKHVNVQIVAPEIGDRDRVLPVGGVEREVQQRRADVAVVRGQRLPDRPKLPALRARERDEGVDPVIVHLLHHPAARNAALAVAHKVVAVCVEGLVARHLGADRRRNRGHLHKQRRPARNTVEQVQVHKRPRGVCLAQPRRHIHKRRGRTCHPVKQKDGLQRGNGRAGAEQRQKSGKHRAKEKRQEKKKKKKKKKKSE
jgi:hypothetical protein